MRPPEQVRDELTRQWLDKADVDFRVASDLLASEDYADPVCFHAQQSAEKYLKAFLTWKGIEFPKTHDLERLLNLIMEVDEGLAGSLRDASALSDYGVDVRYPSDFPGPEPEDAKEAVALAGKVREAVVAILERRLSSGQKGGADG